MNYSGMHNGNIVVEEGQKTKVSGMVRGDAYVKKGASLKISGQLTGNILLDENATLKVSGMVCGNVTKKDNTSTTKVTGMVTGKTFVLNEESFNATSSSMEVTNEMKDEVEEQYDTKYSFKDSDIKNMSTMTSSITISGNMRKGNTSFINGKEICVTGNKGTSITQRNGKTIVNGIDLDTIEPDEDGIYYV